MWAIERFIRTNVGVVNLKDHELKSTGCGCRRFFPVEFDSEQVDDHKRCAGRNRLC